ncbi:hypothetical protein DVH24_018937 [Malus domestica]|uniref:Uncharacterized protein n=1 Tax=Malus domestica TaxID=3750 RepID=A0A498HNW1_MALDO|nr:hypothetical protein DVH24_018937 [Malus domestica]
MDELRPYNFFLRLDSVKGLRKTTESCCIGLLERMAEDNCKMEGSFGKKHLIPDEGFFPESKY